MTLSECLMYNIRRDARVLYIRSRTPKRSEGSVMEAERLDRIAARQLDNRLEDEEMFRERGA
jgi:hypothetical protein